MRCKTFEPFRFILSEVFLKTPAPQRLRGGGRTRARTWDPMIKSHLLYQLSYAPGSDPEVHPSRDGVV